MRDGMGSDPSQIPTFLPLAQGGIKFIMGPGSGNNDVADFLTTTEQFIAQTPAGSVTAIEGPNEVFNWPVTYNGQSGIAGALAEQTAIWQGVKASSVLSSIPVVNLTYGGGSPSDYAQFGNVENIVNFGNAHLYPQTDVGGGIPPYTMYQANIPWQVSSNTPDMPTYVTETGFYTYPDNSYGVNEDVQARYSLDIMFDTPLLNIPKLYFYMLIDNNTNSVSPMEDSFGLFYSTGNPKPAATAIHNMTTILSDASVSTTTYNISGLPSSGHSLSLSGSAGENYLAVWAEPIIWDQSTDTELPAPTVNVAANLGTTYATVNVYDPMIGTTPIATYQNTNNVPLAITDHPLIVEMQ